MWIHIGEEGEGFWSRIVSKEVAFDPETVSNPGEWEVFALLHEIGHVKTNTIKQKRCEQEYLATQWALDESKNWGFKVSKNTIKVYQSYIWDWREKGIKMGARTMPSKDELKLSVANS